jgi:photosystem II stability/assembly factor-like uncharacterized protein
MCKSRRFKSKSSALEAAVTVIFFLAISLALPGAREASANAALALQPAVATSAATKATMLGSARAGKRIVAVGEHGIVLLSDNEGKNFRQARSVPVRSTLTEVFFVDDRTGWAVGHWGVILATEDGGENWHVQRADTNADQPLLSVYFKDKKRGWAVGIWSLLLDTRDGGKTWNASKLPVPPGGGKGDRNLEHIFAGKNGALMIAAEQGMVVHSSDDGATWNYSATSYKGSFWTGITLQNGTMLVGGLRGKIYRSTDGGKSWKEVNSGTSSSLTSFCESGGKIYAAGLDGVYLESKDGGATFVARQRDDKAPITALAPYGSGGVLAFSKNGVLGKLEDEKQLSQNRAR